MSYLVADAGNSRIKWGIYDSGKWLGIESHIDWSEESIISLLQKYPGVEAGMFCSVREVPPWLSTFFTTRNIAWHELTHEFPLPIEIGYETPETLGRDRIALAAGAAAMFPGKNVLAIDAGTALTYELITSDGKYPGGNISPGLRMRFEALHQNTFSLPKVSPGQAPPLIGKNTREAILSGVVNGMVYEIDNSINSLKNKYNELTIILTGGDAAYLAGLLKNPIFVDENLVLFGLCTILRNFSGKPV
jgi:type III pantothenate kinase